jgi:hypothetical protein
MDGRMDEKTEGETNRLRWMYRRMDRQTVRQAHGHMHKQTNRQTDRRTENKTHIKIANKKLFNFLLKLYTIYDRNL